jgi:hypothetical protein
MADPRKYEATNRTLDQGKKLVGLLLQFRIR